MARSKPAKTGKRKTVKKPVQNPSVKVRASNKSGSTLPVLDLSGKIVGELAVPEKIFSTKPNFKLLAHYVRVYRSNQRQATASAKTRGEVRGSTRKIYRQKGTGRARHGDIKAPIFVGGGVAGAVKPRNYRLKINKKQKRSALLSSLSLKLKEQKIAVLDKSFLEIEAKTKIVADFLRSASIEGQKILFILPNKENNLVKSAKNIPNVNSVDVFSLNPYLILENQKLFFVDSALADFKKHFLTIH